MRFDTEVIYRLMLLERRSILLFFYFYFFFWRGGAKASIRKGKHQHLPNLSSFECQVNYGSKY